MKFFAFSITSLCLLMNSSLLQAQVPVQDTGIYSVQAVFTEAAPFIDGDLIDEAWQGVEPVTSFTQVWPNDGAPATEDTEVRIAYDRDNLYFAFRFYDENPDLIRARNLERGGRNSRDDHAYIAIDTYLDGRNAYLFEANALGTQDDALITDEDLTYSGYSWDAVFHTETQIDDEGWTLEVAIPFRQLRFPEGDELEFGLMLSRTIIRKNERVIWPDIGFEYGGYRGVLSAVSQYGRVTGIRNIRRGNNIELKPYVISGAQEVRPDLASEETEVDYTYDIGGDLKWGISSNLTMDLTVNTDFAQVEADNVQLNLSRFSLFFPEKREFFLERAGLFEHGNQRSTQTFFSRSIGLDNQILAGARMTGQAGRFSYGAMNIETGDRMNQLFGDASSNNTVARIRSTVMPRASVGAILTNVERPGAYNRAFGLDGDYRFWSSSEFRTWFTRVWDSNDARSGDAGHASLQLADDTYSAGFSYTSVGEDYFPELGFVRRRDLREYSGNLGYNPVISVKGIESMQRFNLSSAYEYIEGQDGVKQTSALSASAGIEFRNNETFRIGASEQFERLEDPFSIRPDAIIPSGDYTFRRFSVSGETDESKRLFGSANIAFGEFFNGTRTDFGASIGFRQSRHFSVDLELDHSMIDLPIPNGSFDATTVSTSMLGAVSRELYAKALIQYDNFSRNIQSNLRINWIHTPGSDLFLVFNTSYHLSRDNEELFDPRKDLIMNSRAGVVKLTYLIML